MRWHQPPTPPGRLPPPPGGRDPPPLNRRNDGGHRCDGGGEYGYRDDVNACDRHRHVVHWAGGSGGDDGSGVATEDDDDTDAEAGGYARLGRAFREEEDDNEDGDEQGRRARRRRRDAVEVRDALRGGAVVVVVHGSPEAMIISNDRGEGKRGGSFTDETIMDGAKTTATTELGMCQ